jgi:membrane protease YdiL (CAAX protease family)
MRGVVQLPIMGRLGSIRAQIVAGAVFVILHTLTRSGMAEFAFIGLTAIVCGLLTSASRSVWAPAAVHGMSNASIALVVLAFRP